MKKLMICPKESGNTYKICSYIAARSGTELMVIGQEKKVDPAQYGIVVFASGVYGGRVHKKMLEWIRNSKIGLFGQDAKIYVLLTWFGRGESDRAALEGIRSLLDEKGVKTEDKYVKYFGGGMGFIKRTHPDQKDLENALRWVEGL